MRKSVLNKTTMVTALLGVSAFCQAQDVIQLYTGDNELVKGSYYSFPAQTADNKENAPEEQVYYLPDFFEKDGNGYKFLGESGQYAISIYKKEHGYGSKNYYLQVWPKDAADDGDDEVYAHLEKDFGAIWVSGTNIGLPNYQNYPTGWSAWDTFAMTQTTSKVYEMTVTFGKEFAPNAEAKFWFYNFSQNKYRQGDTASGKAEYGIPDGSGDWTRASHEYEFRGNQWNNDDFVPLLKMANCDFMEVSKHTAEHDALGGDAALPQYGNGNMKGMAVGDYSDLPNLPVSTDKHTYKYKFTIDLREVNDIKQDHKGEPDFAYGVTIENKGDKYQLENYQVDSYDDIILDSETKGNAHAIPLRDALRFQGGVLYADHFKKKFNRMTITGYLNQSQDIAFLAKIANNIKVLDLSGVTGIENGAIPADFAQGSTDLEEVILPASLTTIGANAFANCPNLKIVRVKGNNAANGADASAFQGINANQCELVFEDGADGKNYRNGGWMNILTKDIYENAERASDKDYNVCHQANADVRLHRQFTGKWETIVLPFDVTKEQILTKEGNIDHASYFYDFVGNYTNGIIRFINIHHANTQEAEYDLSAGHPFLLRIKDGYTSPADDIHTFENVETKAVEDLAAPKEQSKTINGLTFVGVYNATAKDQDKLNDIFALKNGLFYHANNASMKGYRAWFEKQNTDIQSAKALTFTEVDDSNSTTAIIGMDANGTLQEAFDIYNLNGQMVKKQATSTEGLPTGIYIINQKKVAIQ